MTGSCRETPGIPRNGADSSLIHRPGSYTSTWRSASGSYLQNRTPYTSRSGSRRSGHSSLHTSRSQPEKNPSETISRERKRSCHTRPEGNRTGSPLWCTRRGINPAPGQNRDQILLPDPELSPDPVCHQLTGPDHLPDLLRRERKSLGCRFRGKKFHTDTPSGRSGNGHQAGNGGDGPIRRRTGQNESGSNKVHTPPDAGSGVNRGQT